MLSNETGIIVFLLKTIWNEGTRSLSGKGSEIRLLISLIYPANAGQYPDKQMPVTLQAEAVRQYWMDMHRLYHLTCAGIEANDENFVNVKRAIALFFLAAYLLFATEIGQLLKIPAFVSHFTEHQQQKTDLTLWEFLCIHYAHGVAKDADYEKDMKLPFKVNDQSGAQVSITTPPSPGPFPESRPVHFRSGMKFFIEDVRLTSSFLSVIWQPPRAC